MPPCSERVIPCASAYDAGDSLVVIIVIVIVIIVIIVVIIILAVIARVAAFIVIFRISGRRSRGLDDGFARWLRRLATPIVVPPRGSSRAICTPTSPTQDTIICPVIIVIQ
jgi:hypothetical protein